MAPRTIKPNLINSTEKNNLEMLVVSSDRFAIERVAEKLNP